MTLLKGIKCNNCLTISVQEFPKNVYLTGQTYTIYLAAKIINASSKYLVVTFPYIANYFFTQTLPTYFAMSDM